MDIDICQALLEDLGPIETSVLAYGMISELKFLVPWGHIAAKAWGSPQGRPVLCLHGWLDNANTFNRLIPLLPKDCYYMAVDFGGHGLSSHRPLGFPYHFLDYVGDVRRVVEALKWSRFTLMGHSLGGTVAGMFSCIFPDMVDKLILVESYGFFPAPKGDERGPGLSRQKKSSSSFTPKDAPSLLEEYERLLKSKQKLFERLLNFEAKQYSNNVRSPQEALQRLLKANPHLTEDSGKILLQRGTTEVEGGVVYNRDIRITLLIVKEALQWTTVASVGPLLLPHLLGVEHLREILRILKPPSGSHEHNHSFVTLDQSLIFLKKIQADVLMIITRDGIFSIESEDMPNVKPLQEAFTTFLRERYRYVDVPGNHFVHLNEPEVIAGIISAFLSKGKSFKASL